MSKKQKQHSPPPCFLSITLLLFLYLPTFFITLTLCSTSQFHGLHPLDLDYYATDVIKCKDGSKSFSKDRLNDDFCDCFDGTDEPGTSACPTGKFYCRNMGSQPRFLFSSRVNDHICDCCDGSDEYDGAIYCPNTCIMGNSIEYKTESHHTTSSNTQANERKDNGTLEDIIHNLKDLKVLALIQLIIILFWAFLLFRHRMKSSRQRQRS